VQVRHWLVELQIEQPIEQVWHEPLIDVYVEIHWLQIETLLEQLMHNGSTQILTHCELVELKVYPLTHSKQILRLLNEQLKQFDIAQE
jgi:hypothetical protein